MFYNTTSVEAAIQVVGGVMPGGYTTARLGKDIPMKWDYEFQMEMARKELGLSAEEKITLLLAREYVYSQLKEEDLPEPVKIWRKKQAKIKEEMNKFNSFMEEIASGKRLNQPTLVSKAKKYFPSLKITNKMRVKRIVGLVLESK